MKTGLVVLLFVGAALAPIKSSAQNLLQNGNFESGNLTDWTVFVTSNGDLGSGWGLPNVVSFDVAGTGTPSLAAQFEAGEASYNAATGHTAQGGGIYQTFNASAGKYNISADIAALNPPGYENIDAGLFTLLMDGTSIASVELGAINGGQTLRNTLDATVPLSAGSHEISLEITRPWLNGNGGSPYQYLDNILVEPVPEPSVILVGLLGLICILTFRKSSQRHFLSATALPGQSCAVGCKRIRS